MTFTMYNESFTCEHCSEIVEIHPEWSARNHCPKCLYSKHVDDVSPGDRSATCHAKMKPIGIDYRKNKGYMIEHECTKCKKHILNKVAPDDHFLDFIKLLNAQRN